ncbi:MAG: cation/multidrug efflux pump [Gammaproteobacteria bacterium]
METNIVALLVFAAGCLFLFLSARGFRRRYLLRGMRNGTFAVLCWILAAALSMVGLNLYTYQRLTSEQPVAELYFEQTSPNQFRARVRYADGRTRSFELVGDEWQLDARILKWTGLAAVLGFDARFRLERISGRFNDVELERVARRTVYSLADDSGLDIWQIAQEHKRWVPWVDAVYGSATYLPMADRTRYSVSATQSGLIARPANTRAKETVNNWR